MILTVRWAPSIRPYALHCKVGKTYGRPVIKLCQQTESCHEVKY